MLKNRKIDHISLIVPDLKLACNYYQEELGFTLVEHFVDDKGKNMYFLKSADNFLYEFTEEPRSREGSVDHIAYVTDNIVADYKYVKEKKYVLLTPEITFIDELWEYGVDYFVFLTPTKEKIEITQKRKR